MKRFILSAPPDSRGLIRLSGDDFHYLARVRRLGRGDCFDALLPSGEAVRVRVLSVKGSCLTGECLFGVSAGSSVGVSAGPSNGAGPSVGVSVGPSVGVPAGISAEPSEGAGSSAPPVAELPPLLLFQALPKGAKMDLIVRQAVEGGIAEIVPFASAYSVPRIQSPEEGKVPRWRRIIKEARQQSGSPVDTVLREPGSVDSALDYWQVLRGQYAGALGLLLHPSPELEGEGGASGPDPLARGGFHGYLSTSPGLVVLAVGPEGGFSPDEASRFMAAGFKPLTMGNNVLRVETAALYAAAAVRIILLEKASWTLKPR
jgi:16S rRNA (uracil1498-N3)-methyltransferase